MEIVNYSEARENFQQVKVIADFEGLGFLKYFFCPPKYRQLIQKAKIAIAGS